MEVQYEKDHSRACLRGRSGFIVYCPELDITTEGETVEEAIEMLKDAAAGYIEVVGIENIPHFSPQ